MLQVGGRDRLGVGQRLAAVIEAEALGQRRFGQRQPGDDLRVFEFDEQVAFLHQLTFLECNALDEAGDARLNVDRFVRPRSTQCLDLVDYFLPVDDLRDDLRGTTPATASGAGGLFLATGQQRGERQGQDKFSQWQHGRINT